MVGTHLWFFCVTNSAWISKSAFSDAAVSEYSNHLETGVLGRKNNPYSSNRSNISWKSGGGVPNERQHSVQFGGWIHKGQGAGILPLANAVAKT